MKVSKLYSAFFFALGLIAMLWFAFMPKAQASDDLFWYAYPMPQAYLYVQNPLLYRMWEANYGYRQTYTPMYSPARSSAYMPVVRHYNRTRFRRRECEIRILAGHRQ